MSSPRAHRDVAFLLFLLKGSMGMNFYQPAAASSGLAEFLTAERWYQSPVLGTSHDQSWIRLEYRRTREPGRARVGKGWPGRMRQVGGGSPDFLCGRALV